MIGLRALNRMRKIQYAQTQATRVRWLVSEFEAERKKGLYLGVTGDPRRYRQPDGTPIDSASYAGALPSRLVPVLAELRTDLNRFSMTEASLLAYHGYWSTHARFNTLRPHHAIDQPAWSEFETMSNEEAEHIEQNLRGRRHRVGIGERMR